MIKRISLFLFMVVIAVSLAGGSWAAKEPPDQTAARKAFEAYRSALKNKDFGGIYDMINPEILVEYERAFAKAKANKDYLYVFVTTNFEGYTPSEVNIGNTLRDLFKVAGETEIAGKGFAMTGGLGIAMKTLPEAKIVAIDVAKPKLPPNFAAFPPEAKKVIKEAYQRALNTASVQYQTKNGEKGTLDFKKIKGKWMLNGSPFSFWTEEEEKTEE